MESRADELHLFSERGGPDPKGHPIREAKEMIGEVFRRLDSELRTSTPTVGDEIWRGVFAGNGRFWRELGDTVANVTSG